MWCRTRSGVGEAQHVPGSKLGCKSQVSLTLTHTDTHTHIYIYICIYICTCICRYIYIYLFIYLFIYPYVCIYIERDREREGERERERGRVKGVVYTLCFRTSLLALQGLESLDSSPVLFHNCSTGFCRSSRSVGKECNKGCILALRGF